MFPESNIGKTWDAFPPRVCLPMLGTSGSYNLEEKHEDDIYYVDATDNSAYSMMPNVGENAWSGK